MSADRWSICPKCMKAAERAKADLIKRVETDYGKIAADEYLELVEQSRQLLAQGSQTWTMREDWKMGICLVEFRVDYCASCEECGFSYAFKHTEKLSDDNLLALP